MLEHIRDQLPELRNKINQLIVSTQSELQSYGDLGLSGKAHRGTLLLKLVTTYVTDFQEAIQGTLKTASIIQEPAGGAKINQIFNEVFAEAVNNINSTNGLTVIDVRNAIKNSTGPRPSLFVPEASFEVLTKQQIAKLQAPALRCVDLVYEELQRLAMKLDRRELLRFPILAQKLANVSSELLRERLDPTIMMVENLIQIETAYINTNHPDFWKSGSALSILAKIIEERRRRETSQIAASLSKSNEEVPPQSATPSAKTTAPVPYPVGKDEGGLLSYLFRTTNPPPNPKEHRRAHGKPVATPTSIPSPVLTEIDFWNELSEKEEVETKLIISLINSYFSIVKKNLLDTVPKAIMHFLVNHVSDHLPTRLVTELYKDDKIDELLQEDELVVRQRERCRSALDAYRQAAILLSQVRDSDIYKKHLQ